MYGRNDRANVLSLDVKIKIISSYHIVVLRPKRQNRLKVGTDKPKLKFKMQSVSDDDVQKRLLEKPRLELAAKGVFRLGRRYILWQGAPGLRASNWEKHGYRRLILIAGRVIFWIFLL